MNCYLAGTLVRVATYTGTIEAPSGGFRGEDGNLADPTAVTLLYRSGSVQLATFTYGTDEIVVRDGTGLYHADLDTTGSPASQWTYEWTGAGTVIAAADGAFNVEVAFP